SPLSGHTSSSGVRTHAPEPLQVSVVHSIPSSQSALVMHPVQRAGISVTSQVGAPSAQPRSTAPSGASSMHSPQVSSPATPLQYPSLHSSPSRIVVPLHAPSSHTSSVQSLPSPQSASPTHSAHLAGELRASHTGSASLHPES